MYANFKNNFESFCSFCAVRQFGNEIHALMVLG